MHDDEFIWFPAAPSNIFEGDLVRVRLDAFGPVVGPKHNGRIGVVIQVSGEDVVVKSIDARKPRLSKTHYPCHKLEKNFS